MQSTTLITGRGSLPSAFAVSRLAVESLALAAEAIADLVATDNPRPPVTIDRVLASWWFSSSFRPVGWELPPVWDAIAGDYATADSWIRLHTNAVLHRRAALTVLGWSPDEAPHRDAVAAVVRSWTADDLESAIVAAGGVAAAMRTASDWAAHPQGHAVALEPLIDRFATGQGSEASGASDWQTTATAHRPLACVRVLDLTRVLAGPVATRFLAGFGAEVLRIDPPDWDEPAVVHEVTLGKRCARLDAGTTDGRDHLRRLLAGADVLVHGYRPGALDALIGLDTDGRAALRPGLVEVCLDAYGWTGPWAGRRGFDSLVQMSSGIAAAGMTWAGREMPTPLPVQALDHATGYLMAGAAVDGLRARHETGRGSVHRASLARTACWLADLPVDDDGPLAEPDWRSAVEETTVWGEGRRLPSPVVIEGAPMRWERHAVPLGVDTAAWSTD